MERDEKEDENPYSRVIRGLKEMGVRLEWLHATHDKMMDKARRLAQWDEELKKAAQAHEIEMAKIFEDFRASYADLNKKD